MHDAPGRGAPAQAPVRQSLAPTTGIHSTPSLRLALCACCIHWVHGSLRWTCHETKQMANKPAGTECMLDVAVIGAWLD